MLNQEQIRRLLEKFERGTCTEEELRQLQDWLDNQAARGKDWEFAGEDDKARTKSRMEKVVLSAIQSAAANPPSVAAEPAPVRRIGGRPWLKWVAVAAAILLVIWGVGLLERPAAVVKIASGPGEMKKILLPDGSTAWLNDNSELAWREGFAGGRTVELRRGEAFFDVKKDADHVFSVQSDSLTTTVLGTSFSIKKIGAGDLNISVVTGKVMVSRHTDTLGFLRPNQRLRYHYRSEQAAVDTLLAGEADGWIHGDIFLRNASLAEVIQLLENHFKVTVHNKRLAYTGEYYLQAKSDISLPEIVQILNLLGKKDHVQFSLRGQSMTIQ